MVMETERLRLRRFEEKDLDDFHDYAKDPQVGPPAGWKPHESLEESREILNAFMRSEDIFALVEKETGRVIGSMGLHEDRKRDYKGAIMIGYAMASTHWGRGLMLEGVCELLKYAFQELNTEIISAYHYPFNRRSGRVLEKAGFRFEGTLRLASVLPDGTIVDDVCYSMMRSEFETLLGQDRADKRE